MKSGAGWTVVLAGVLLAMCVGGAVFMYRPDQTAPMVPQPSIPVEAEAKAVEPEPEEPAEEITEPEPAEEAHRDPLAPLHEPEEFPAWAVIKTPDALMRNPTGKATGRIKTGTVMIVTGPRVSATLNMYPCHREKTAPTGAVSYVAYKDLDFHSGTPEEADPLVRPLAIQRAGLLAAIHNIDHGFEKTNPYRRLIVKLHADRAALKKQMPALIATRDAAQAGARLRANEELQTLRDEIAALDRKEKTLRVSMMEWSTTRRNAAAENPERAEIITELAQVNRQLLDVLDANNTVTVTVR